MNMVFFFYTIALLAVCVVAALASASAYISSRRRVYAYGFGVFVCYAVETTEIFFNEYLAQNIPFDAAAYYDVSMPVVRTLVAACLYGCMWAMVLDVTDRHSKRLLAIPPALLAAGSFAVLALVPFGALRQWGYYSLRQVFLFFMCAFALAVYLRSRDAAIRARLEHFKWALLTVVLLGALVLVEATVNILVMPMSVHPMWLPLYLSERNFSENALMLFLAVALIRRSVEEVSLRIGKAPEATETDDLTRHIDERIQPFCERHGISKRESEVLRLVLQGKSNLEIADELYLALGTVKTHVHNLLVKCGKKKREDLILYFWQS